MTYRRYQVMMKKTNPFTLLWILVVSAVITPSLVNADAIAAENYTEVDVGQLYTEEAEWSLNDPIPEEYDTFNVTVKDSSNSGANDLSHQIDFDNIGGDAFLLNDGVSINMGRMEDFENNCAVNDTECLQPLDYTFAMWVSLKPNSLNDTQDRECRPVAGVPVRMFIPAGFDTETKARIVMMITQRRFRQIKSNIPTILMRDFMWNHFAIVVTNKTSNVYCNGAPCNGHSDLEWDRESNYPFTILNVNIPASTPSAVTTESTENATTPIPGVAGIPTTGIPAASIADDTPIVGCKQVAYERVTLWDRALSPSEIQALRFKPFIFSNVTTPAPSTVPQRPKTTPTTPTPPTTTTKPTTTLPTTTHKITEALVFDLPTGSPDEQVDFLLDQFDEDSDIVLDSPEQISQGVDAFLGVLDGFLVAPPIDDGTGKSYSYSSGYTSEFVSIEETDEGDEEVVAFIGLGGSLIAAMAEAGLKIPAGESSSQSRFDMLKFLNSLIDLDLKTGGKDVTNLDGPSLLVSLRQFMDSYFREREVDFINPRDGFKHIHVYEQSGLDRMMTPVYLTFTEDGNPNNADVFIIVPTEAYEDYRYVRMITGAIYNGIQLSLPREISRSRGNGAQNRRRRRSTDGNTAVETVEVSSPVVAVILNYNTSHLKQNISFLYRHREKRMGEETICAYLRFEPEVKWETDGCYEGKVNNTFTLCFCEDLTNFAFAVLIATDGLILNAWHDDIATMLTYATMPISVLCLMITVFILLIYRKSLKTKRMRVLRHTALAMLLAHLLFLFGDLALEDNMACTVVAAALYYLFLCVFCWMFIMGFQLYTKVRRAHKTQVDFLYYIIFGWGFPVGITGISVASNTDVYGAPGAACWMNPKDKTIYLFVGPAMGILFFNALVMILVLRSFRKVEKYKDATTITRMRSAAKGVVAMLPVLGLTWAFGVVAQHSYAFVYLFILLNAIQGIFLFIFHVIFNSEVKDAIKGKQRVKDSSGLSSVAAPDNIGDRDGDESDLIKG